MSCLVLLRPAQVKVYIKMEGVTYRLGAVVGMSVDVDLILVVRHILGGIDLVELSLAIRHFEFIGDSEVGVFTEECSDQRRELFAAECIVESKCICLTNTEKGENTPS